MKIWLLLGILSYLSYSVSTSIDKNFMNKKYDPVTTNAFKMFFDGSLLLIASLFFTTSFTENILLWSILLGFLYALSGIFYMNMLKRANVEMVLPLSQSMLILATFTGGILAFGEDVIFLNVIGLFSILLGIFLVTTKRLKALKVGHVIYLILFMVIAKTAYSLIVKHVLSGADPFVLSILVYFSSSIFLLGYALTTRTGRIFSLRNSRILISSVFGALGTILLFYALKEGFASKVYPLAGLQSVFVFIIATIFLKERPTYIRGLGVLAVFAGVYMLSI
ncbi:MAG: EamA family transporter [Nanobdellota archaeon]